MNLYEIDNRIAEAFEAAVDQDTGEIIDEQAYEALNGLQMDREQKIEGILLWIKDLSAHAGDIKKEKDTLAQRQKAAENKAESLKRYVASVLSGEKFSTSELPCHGENLSRWSTPGTSIIFLVAAYGRRIQKSTKQR